MFMSETGHTTLNQRQQRRVPNWVTISRLTPSNRQLRTGVSQQQRNKFP